MMGLAVIALVCALIPAVMFWVNLGEYAPPGGVETGAERTRVSVLIPARDEEGGIRAAVASVLASAGVELEVVVMDDGSTDRTAAIVLEMAGVDGRVRLELAPALPVGWNGKQHACWALAGAARYPVMCFVDADVRLEPEALARMAAFLRGSGAALVSGFPRQVTGTFLERLLLPLIHFVLLGFLPVGRMRAGTDPAMAAGCGQFMMVRREAYLACGGHSGIRETMHDGLRLPRLFREHGLRTDLADLTSLATCRMYRSAGQVWSGLAKNATEGLATPGRIVPVTLFLLLGQVTPFLLLGWAVGRGGTTSWGVWVAAAAVMAAWTPRVLGVARFRQSVMGAVLHPLGVVLLLVLQWYALVRRAMGGAVSWKSRAYVGE